jgi:hypothetical protein
MPILLWPFPGGSTPPPAGTASPRLFIANVGRLMTILPGSSVLTPGNAYVAEDGTTFYVAEDGTTYYVQEM